ncbi:folic acid binding / transferase [Trifolium repens]|nr:folic acid binding / transferase [Trifolium repens]
MEWCAKIRHFATETIYLVVIGATNWVDNYNVPLLSSDISAVRRIAKLISGRGGGLASVQAIAITHGEGIIEVACNLLDPKNVVGERVQQEIENLAREEGISVEKGYYPDFSHEEIVIMQNEMSYHQ